MRREHATRAFGREQKHTTLSGRVHSRMRHFPWMGGPEMRNCLPPAFGVVTLVWPVGRRGCARLQACRYSGPQVTASGTRGLLPRGVHERPGAGANAGGAACASTAAAIGCSVWRACQRCSRCLARETADVRQCDPPTACRTASCHGLPHPAQRAPANHAVITHAYGPNPAPPGLGRPLDAASIGCFRRSSARHH